MSDQKPENPPAFPGTWWDQNSAGENQARECWPGMTLRDWFAGQALAGMVAGSRGLDITIEQFATESYSLADAMLAERERRP